MTSEARTRQVTGRLVGAVLALGVALCSVGPVAAQTDARNVLPMVMLLVDSSGSMEYKATCDCSTELCAECWPNDGSFSRMHLTMQALTGRCSLGGVITDPPTPDWTAELRTEPSYANAIDYGYYIPHYVYNTTCLVSGLMDTYVQKIKFGLMTFDAVGTLVNQNPLVSQATYEGAGFLTDAAGQLGMWSYGTRKAFTVDGCGTTFMMDNGAQNATGPRGGLISVGASDTLVNIAAVNASIQTELAQIRPFGGTPVAGMLDDLSYYLSNDTDVTTGDAYRTCRERYAVLITDGMPNLDMREDPYNCDAGGSSCPYSTITGRATALCNASSLTNKCEGLLDGLYVIGWNISDSTIQTTLDDLAAAGGTGEAQWVDDYTELTEALQRIFNTASSYVVTRSVPATWTSSGVGSAQAQYQVTAGFEAATAPTYDAGLLQRRVYGCTGSSAYETSAVDDDCTDSNGCDDAHRLLNARNLATSPLKIYTALPTDPADRNSYFTGLYGATTLSISVGGDKTSVPDIEETAVARANVSTSVDPRYFGLLVGDTATRDAIVNWVNGTTRSGRRLGPIYNSSPVIMPPPELEFPDEAYRTFRTDATISNRPAVVFVGSNDGMLHAFSLRYEAIAGGDYSHLPLGPKTVKAMEHLWAFIPPTLLDKLNTMRTTGEGTGVDVTPVVQDLFYYHDVGDTSAVRSGPDGYHSVLVAGLGAGDGAYFALDVTDPFDPKFLWQFTSSEMGNTYGSPALAQVQFNKTGGGIQRRAVAILGGGVQLSAGSNGMCGKKYTAGDALQQMTATPVLPRDDGSCWPEDADLCGGSPCASGKHIYVLDVQTGRFIYQSAEFDVPVSGGIAAYPNQIGKTATQAYFTDHDGVLHRLDMYELDPSSWDVAQRIDLYHGEGELEGHPSLPPPIVTVDEDGYRYVITGTTPLTLTSGQKSIVASVRDEYKDARLFWQLGTPDSAAVTPFMLPGPVQLLGGIVYFSAFRPGTSADVCDFGDSYLFGVHYRQPEGGVTDAGALRICETPFCPYKGMQATPTAAAAPVYDRWYVGPFENQIIAGVNFAQRPQCFAGSETTDPYFGSSASRFEVTSAGSASGSYYLVGAYGGEPGIDHAGSLLGEASRMLPHTGAHSFIVASGGTID